MILSDDARRKLIADIIAAGQELDLLMFDEIITGLPNPPATERQVADYERDCQFPLPPSFRAFLLLHDGWPDFLGDAAILGTGWRKLDWTDDALEALEAPFEEFGQEDPIANNAVPALLGVDAFVSLFIWPPELSRQPFHEYQYSELVALHDDFDAFLQGSLHSLRNQIDEERNGINEDTANDL
jgi:hypothetical protein